MQIAPNRPLILQKTVNQSSAFFCLITYSALSVVTAEKAANKAGGGCNHKEKEKQERTCQDSADYACSHKLDSQKNYGKNNGSYNSRQ